LSFRIFFQSSFSEILAAFTSLFLILPLSLSLYADRTEYIPCFSGSHTHTSSLWGLAGVRKIAAASTGIKICLIVVSFHCPFGNSRSETIDTSCPSSGVRGFAPKWLGIHRSRQMLVVVPSPILLISPWDSVSRPARIACQV
jgi:hypothetical protein